MGELLAEREDVMMQRKAAKEALRALQVRLSVLCLSCLCAQHLVRVWDCESVIERGAGWVGDELWR